MALPAFSFLKRHPFAVQAWFEKVVAVSFAFPEAHLKSLIPAGLELDTYSGYGFVTVALVWTKRMRPAGVPPVLGRDFFLAGYRVFTRLPGPRRLRGLYILRSETDRASMVTVGNIFTRYHYRPVKTRVEESGDSTSVVLSRPDGTPSLNLVFAGSSDSLPEGSPFPDWATARQFAGPMPYTFAAQGDGSFVVVKGTRQSWRPAPVQVKHWEVGLFREPMFEGVTPVLANAFGVEHIDYRWERGEIIRPEA